MKGPRPKSSSCVCVRARFLRATPFLRPFGYLMDCPGNGLGGAKLDPFESMLCSSSVAQTSSTVIQVARLMSKVNLNKLSEYATLKHRTYHPNGLYLALSQGNGKQPTSSNFYILTPLAPTVASLAFRIDAPSWTRGSLTEARISHLIYVRSTRYSLKSMSKFPHPCLCRTGNVIMQLRL